MTETVSLVLALTGGVLLGAFFFGGLWWTIRRGLSSQHPALWFLASLLLRTAIVLAGFYVMAVDGWRTLLAGLIGFVAARLAVTWFTRESGPARSAQLPEGGHAPQP